MSVHQRPTLLAPKLRQRVRMDGAVGAPSTKEWPWNAHAPWGHYAETFVAAGCVWFRWCPVGTPPFAHTVCAVVASDATSPRMILDDRGTVTLVYEDGGAVYLTESWDDGLSWSTPMSAFASGTWPTIAIGTDGSVMIGARVGGELQIRRRAPGDTAFGTAFVAQDDASADLDLADDSFHLSQAPTGPGHWLLHCRRDGASDSTTWFSTDDAETFGEF
jgi:hypothetical protein